MPAPSGSREVTIWGVSDPEVGSLAELNSGPAGYSYEPATGLIHLRFTPEHRGGEIG